MPLPSKHLVQSLLCLLLLNPNLTTASINVVPASQLTPLPQTPHLTRNTTLRYGLDDFDPLDDLRKALDVMQTSYFELWLGVWPTAIDWTAAVMNTHTVSALATFSRALDDTTPASGDTCWNTAGPLRDLENDLNRYFSQSVAYYFGEDAFAIRNQAFDDMLWVVLGWLESIKFTAVHSRLHYHSPLPDGSFRSWHGAQFVKAFAHRARVFYDLASRGWDTSLCGGGMVWNPVLEPYKNAITNQLFIAASVGMYLYFPGDHNSSPFLAQDVKSTDSTPAEPHDPSYLRAAVQGYEWLANSNMTNAQGLYVDGFHISGLKRNSTTCDARNEMVYTYNQGVLLSGLRGLWESTGNVTYLTDGHDLVRNTIKATGWELDLGAATTAGTEWAGLGRAGILEDFCDAQGDCSQDGQTFKGIFFHHLTLFCEPLPSLPLYPGKTHAAGKELALLHHQSCQEYALWIAHNARAAVSTRDADGKFGTFWGNTYLETSLPDGAVDYRNNASELLNWPWLLPDSNNARSHQQGQHNQVPMTTSAKGDIQGVTDIDRSQDVHMQQDLNDRGRGRTVETQGGGVAVLRALWELLNMR